MTGADGGRRPRELKYSAPALAGAEQPAGPELPAPQPVDPERGLRGVMSAILVFEAIAILLGLTVIANGGASAPGWQIAVILGLALAHILAPALIRKSWAVILIFALQGLFIACWVISGAIGAMGVVFLAVWVTVILMRREFRRRLADSQGLAQ